MQGLGELPPEVRSVINLGWILQVFCALDKLLANTAMACCHKNVYALQPLYAVLRVWITLRLPAGA